MSTLVEPPTEPGPGPSFRASQDDHSDVDGDGSSSLSEIDDDDKPGDQGDADVDMSDLSDRSEEDDSEAETERLENSPHAPHRHKDVVLSHSESKTYERSPSKLQQQVTASGEEEEEEDEEDDEPLSDEDQSVDGSSKSISDDEAEKNTTTASTSLDPAGEAQKIADANSRKRKRPSIFGGVGDVLTDEEPALKRTGTIVGHENEDLDDEQAIIDDEADEQLPTSRDDDDEDADEDADNEEGDNEGDNEEEPATNDNEDEEEDPPVIIQKPNTQGRQRLSRTRKTNSDSTLSNDPNSTDTPAASIKGNGVLGDDDNADQDVEDEVDIATKNEEELEKKRVALEQLTSIEKRFATFRDRLYDERIAQVTHEEKLLRLSAPTHPDYIAMLRCIDARRDEKIRIANHQKELGVQSLKTFAVARRSQILGQYYQEVRDIREKKIELLGRQWYEVQHDRRAYAGSGTEYTLKFPTRRSTQILHQAAYNKEVSILSGVAKYVGFPAAPPMGSATPSERDIDLKEILGTQSQLQPTARSRHRGGLPTGAMSEIAALRAASTVSGYPAEQQFIESTPWANPQHPSHAHLLSRQASGHHTPRTQSPFSATPTQQGENGKPAVGTFLAAPTGRASPHNHNSFTGPSHSHNKVVPSPLASRLQSMSPKATQSSAPPPSEHSQPLNIHNGLSAQSEHMWNAERSALADVFAPGPERISHQ